MQLYERRSLLIRQAILRADAEIGSRQTDGNRRRTANIAVNNDRATVKVDNRPSL